MMYTMNSKMLYGFLGISMLLCTACMSAAERKPSISKRMSVVFGRNDLGTGGMSVKQRIAYFAKGVAPVQAQQAAASHVVTAPAVARPQTPPQRAKTPVKQAAAIAEAIQQGSRPTTPASHNSDVLQLTVPADVVPGGDQRVSRLRDEAIAATPDSEFRPGSRGAQLPEKSAEVDALVAPLSRNSASPVPTACDTAHADIAAIDAGTFERTFRPIDAAAEQVQQPQRPASVASGERSGGRTPSSNLQLQPVVQTRIPSRTSTPKLPAARSQTPEQQRSKSISPVPAPEQTNSLLEIATAVGEQLKSRSNSPASHNSGGEQLIQERVSPVLVAPIVPAQVADQAPCPAAEQIVAQPVVAAEATRVPSPVAQVVVAPEPEVVPVQQPVQPVIQAPVVPVVNAQDTYLTPRNIAIGIGLFAIWYKWQDIKAWWNSDNKPKEDPVAQELINAQVKPVEVK